MKFPSENRIFTWALPTVLVCVFTAVAFLQYRWSHEVSEAASTRMHASLQNSMLNFRQDVSRELAMMCLELQGDNVNSVDAKRLTQRVQLWQNTSSLNGLILHVYEWKGNDADDADAPLLRLSMREARFEKMQEWPKSFANMHELLRATSSTAPDLDDIVPSENHLLENGTSPAGHGAASAHSSNPVETNEPIVGAIDQSIPLLVFPAMRNSETIWLLLELDPHVFEERLFPQLAERYFGDTSSSDYEVAVVGGKIEQPQVLYTSGAGFGEHSNVMVDAALNLFGPPMWLIGTAPPPLDPAGALQAASHAASHVTSAPIPSSPLGMGFYKIRFDPIRSGHEDRGWRIIAQHRTGSVAAAVARLRFRNLVFSFGVLLVLAGSMALIIFNSYRARRLAALQMEFVAGVSHELRTPVAAILSISENIVDGVVENEQQLLRYGGMIRNQAKRLHHLVEQVLRFAATQNGTTSYTIRLLDVSDVIDEVLESVSNFVSASGFRVEKVVQPDLPSVRADFGVLSQCLQNLMTNALKYGGDSKWIGIRAGTTGQGASEQVEVTVEDRGIGIAHEEMEHIFEPFYRSPKIVDSQVPGDGLGLALAKSFAEAMGGRLTVVSEVGKGTSFTIHLPAVADGERKRNRTMAIEAQS